MFQELLIAATICIVISLALTRQAPEAIDILTDNLFDNLKHDPFLTDGEFTDEKKAFIETQIANYLALVENSQNIQQHSKKRRSLPVDNMVSLTTDNHGTFVLDNILPINTIEARFPKDIVLFEQNTVWYAVALISESPIQDAYAMQIYKKINATFELESEEIPINKGKKIAAHTTVTGTFLVVAQNSASLDFNDKTHVYKFGLEEDLIKIQSLEEEFSHDVVIWEQMGDIFLAFAQHKSNKSGSSTYETGSSVYKWLGQHFDFVQHVPTIGAKKVMPFSIRNSHFLAVANFQNDKEETDVYSEIFIYDIHAEQYVPHQKIRTSAAVDVKFFCFQLGHDKESFMVVANHFAQDLDGNRNYDIHSIIYKYIDNYFIPFQSVKLNGALEWFPVVGTYGEFALVAATKYEGLKTYQYDGWRFVEVTTNQKNKVFDGGVVSMYSYIFCKTPIMVVTNQNDDGSMMNLVQFNFIHKNPMKKIQSETLRWCEKIVNDLEMNEKGSAYRANREAVRDDAVEDNLKSDESEKSEQFLDNTQLIKINQIKADLASQRAILQNMKSVINDLVSPDRINVIPRSVTTENIVALQDIFTDNLSTRKLNNVTVSEFIENIININEGFNIEYPLQINNIEVKNFVTPKIINDQPIESMLRANENRHLKNVTIKGNIIFDDGMTLGDTLDGIRIDRNNILLNEGDQYIPGELKVTTINAEHLQTPFLNKLDLKSINPEENTVPVKSIENLTVKELIVNKYLNDVDVVTLDKYALRTSESQEITAAYAFDNLHLKNLDSRGMISFKSVDEMIRTDKGEYSINHDVLFTNGLIAKDVVVKMGLNEIHVSYNGDLDLLLKDSPKVQYLTGYKQLEDVRLLNPMKLQGKIRNKGLDKVNPVVHIHRDIFLTGDCTINGNVTVEKLMRSLNIVDGKGTHSVKRLWEQGAKIEDQEIGVGLRFLQQLDVDDLHAEKINTLDTTSLLTKAAEQTHHISGHKSFEGDVFVSGTTILHSANNIDFDNFESSALTIDGDQTLTGEFIIPNLLTDGINASSVKVGNKNWENIVTTENEQEINGTTYMTFLKAKSTEIGKWNSSGLVNNKDFSQIVLDTVRKGTNASFNGTKELENLSAVTMQVDSLNTEKLMDNSSNWNNFEINRDITLTDANINGITFDGLCNGYDKQQFHKMWILKENDIFEGDYTFKKATAAGPVYISSGYINNIRVMDLLDNTVKINEPFSFNSANFKTTFCSPGYLTLYGNIINVDLDNIVGVQPEEKQVIYDEIIFMDTVYVNGTPRFENHVSGVNITAFCEFSANVLGYGGEHLVINGSALFIKGPEVTYLNNFPIQDILKNAWFKNREATLSGIISLENTFFRDGVDCEGYVDGFKLQQLEQNYFSKTKDQNISASYRVTDAVMFRNGVSARKADVLGDTLLGLSLEEFLSSVMLNNTDQQFEDIVYFEKCSVKEVEGKYFVNSLDLQNDVIRYDKENIVTGIKTVQNLDVNTMKIKKNINVQGVDFLRFLENAVLKAGNFNISGFKTFSGFNIFTKGIRVGGNVNGYKFDNKSIVLQLGSQNITGYKIFKPKDLNLVHFNRINIQNNINGVNLNSFLTNQVYKNKDNNLMSPVHFNGSIFAKNVIFDKTFSGINVKKLIRNLTRFAEFSDYDRSYSKLLVRALEVQNSLKRQAYFLTGYENVQEYKAHDIIPLKFGDDDHRLALIFVHNSTAVIFARWVAGRDAFVTNEGTSVMNLEMHPQYVTSIKGKYHDYLYIEGQSLTSGGTFYIANIFNFVNDTVTESFGLSTNESSSVIPVIVPGRDDRCLLIVYAIKLRLQPKILCEHGANISVFQTMEITGAIMATFSMIETIPYIIMVTQDNQQQEPYINVWKYSNTRQEFEVVEKHYVVHPNSLSVVFYRNQYYLAVSSGLSQDTMHQAGVEIKRFNKETHKFEHFQTLHLDAPIQVEFVELPTKELILYVLTNSMTEPLMIYEYRGISGFTRKIVAAGLSNALSLRQFTQKDGNHFVVLRYKDTVRIIKAVYKGNMWW